MVKVREDLTGKSFGRLTVLEQTEDYINSNGTHQAQWLCECSCEKHSKIIVRGTNLKIGQTKSCGCLQKEKVSEAKFIDLTDKIFGMLHVIKRSENRIYASGQSKTIWECECNNCGKKGILVQSQHLLNGDTTSCGCMKLEKLRKKHTTHGKTDTRLYKIWCGMKQRCYNKNNIRYKSYGGRGIIICNEWKDSYSNFYNWAIENGYDENAPRGKCTIERLDVNGNYCPDNCKWATSKEQSNNTRCNRIIVIDGICKTISQWADVKGMSVNCICARIDKLGWSEYDAVMIPKGVKRNAGQMSNLREQD